MRIRFAETDRGRIENRDDIIKRLQDRANECAKLAADKTKELYLEPVPTNSMFTSYRDALNQVLGFISKACHSLPTHAFQDTVYRELKPGGFLFAAQEYSLDAHHVTATTPAWTAADVAASPSDVEEEVKRIKEMYGPGKPARNGAVEVLLGHIASVEHHWRSALRRIDAQHKELFARRQAIRKIASLWSYYGDATRSAMDSAVKEAEETLK